ncbi:MAG: CYTH domain-containing protein [Nitrosomonadales bacterium]|nr:CYTH domain-containing protein [Nitrosomonadales bacterium]
MALRLRRAGRQWLQTLKGGGTLKGGLHERHEGEGSVSRAALDFSMPEAAEWDTLLPLSWRDELQLVFVTDFFRSSRLLDWQGSSIEVCMDHGEARTEQHSVPICELELELKSGDPRHLFELALAILEVAVRTRNGHKAERGYWLLSGFVEQPVKAVAPGLSGTCRLADALQTLAWSCLTHLQGNLHGAMWSDDAEYLHQVRVALRRLRVVLRMAGKIRADDGLAALSGEVAAMCVDLGRIRREGRVHRPDDPADVRAWPGHGACRRCWPIASGSATVATPRWRGGARAMQRLMLRFAIWMNGPVPAE